MHFEGADPPAERGYAEDVRGVSFYGFINLDCVVGKDEFSVAAPVRPRVTNSSRNNPVSFSNEVFQRQTLNGRGLYACDK